MNEEEEEEEENKIWEMESRGKERELRTLAISQYIPVLHHCTTDCSAQNTSPHSVSMAVQRARAISCLRWTTAEAEEAREHNETACNGSGQ